jgi:hypothetical protein
MLKPVLFGAHIPKCAGTTLLDRVRQELTDVEIYQTTSIIRNYFDGRSEFLQMMRPDQIRFVFGHTVHEEMLKLLGRPAILFTGLREPRERMLSEINYLIRLRKEQGATSLNIEEYLRNTKNPMCKFIINRFPTLAGQEGSLAKRAIRALSCFNWCYFADNFEETANAIFKALDISPSRINSNVAPKEKVSVVLNEANIECDLELYRCAREMFQETDVDVAISYPKAAIKEFVNAPPKLPELRRFLYDSCYWEYKDWGRLEEIIGIKMRMIHELSAEIQLYLTAGSGGQK